MRGFEDSTNPVQLNLDPVVNTILGNATNTPYSIDGRAAEATDYGVMVNVSGTRYFIPWSKVYMIRQLQVVAPLVGPAIPVTPPSAPKGD